MPPTFNATKPPLLAKTRAVSMRKSEMMLIFALTDAPLKKNVWTVVLVVYVGMCVYANASNVRLTPIVVIALGKVLITNFEGLLSREETETLRDPADEELWKDMAENWAPVVELKKMLPPKVTNDGALMIVDSMTRAKYD